MGSTNLLTSILLPHQQFNQSVESNLTVTLDFFLFHPHLERTIIMDHSNKNLTRADWIARAINAHFIWTLEESSYAQAIVNSLDARENQDLADIIASA
jgi:hypothetical protein